MINGHGLWRIQAAEPGWPVTTPRPGLCLTQQPLGCHWAAASPPAPKADQENCFTIWFDLISLLFFFPTLQALESGRVVQRQRSRQSRLEADFALFGGQWAVPWRQATGAFVQAFGLIRKANYAGRWGTEGSIAFRLSVPVSTWGHLPSFVLGPA